MNRAPSARTGPSDLPPSGKRPETLNLEPGGDIAVHIEDSPHQVVRFNDAVRENGTSWTEMMSDPSVMADSAKHERYLGVKRRMNQLELISRGHVEGLALLSHVTNQERLLPALDELIDAYDAVQDRARFAVAGVSREDLIAIRDRLLQLSRAKRDADDFARSLDVLITHLQQQGSASLRMVYDRLGSSLTTNYDLSTRLTSLHGFFAGPAEQAVETKKLIAKATARAKADSGDAKGADKGEADHGEPATPADPVKDRPKGRG